MADAHEAWYADSWLLTDGWVRDVELRSGLYKSAPLRGDNAIVANRRGAIWRPKTRDVGAFTLNLWLGDISRALVEQWWDQLLRACNPADRLVVYTRYLAGGGSRYCRGEVVQAVEPQDNGNNLIRCGLEVSVPEGVWWDNTGSKTNATTGAGALLSLPLTNFANVTAEQHDLTYTITGPINNPTVTDATNGLSAGSFTYNGVIGAGQQMILNASTWALTGVGGFAPAPGKLVYTAARYLVVPPGRPGTTPIVQMTNTGGTTAATGLSVSGVPAYAV